jgi:hypothetical protein
VSRVHRSWVSQGLHNPPAIVQWPAEFMLAQQVLPTGHPTLQIKAKFAGGASMLASSVALSIPPSAGAPAKTNGSPPHAVRRVMAPTHLQAPEPLAIGRSPQDAPSMLPVKCAFRANPARLGRQDRSIAFPSREACAEARSRANWSARCTVRVKRWFSGGSWGAAAPPSNDDHQDGAPEVRCRERDEGNRSYGLLACIASHRFCFIGFIGAGARRRVAHPSFHARARRF